MKKENVIISILVILLISVSVFSFLTYNKTVMLNSEIETLNTDIIQLNNDKEQLIADKDSLVLENGDLKDKLQRIQADVSTIYKTCMKDNACKGRFPGISWECNNVGDEVSDPSHNCVCDSSCNLNATAM